MKENAGECSQALLDFATYLRLHGLESEEEEEEEEAEWPMEEHDIGEQEA